MKDVTRMAQRALAQGARVVRRNVVYWDTSAGCDDPYQFTVEGRSAVTVGVDRYGAVTRALEFNEHLRPIPGREYGADSIVWLDIDAPCRKCRPCLKRRAVAWAYRAKSEIAAAPRTWFGTLTASEAQHELFEWRARAKIGVGPYLKLTADERFKAVSAEMGREATTWLKRVRKESGARLRYLLVVEAHKSGRPHLHILVHEREGNGTVYWRTLHDQWKCGFSLFKLVPDKDKYAWYVCKYLNKSALTRVRASAAYGSSDHALEHNKA